MIKADLDKQLMVTVENKVGTLAEITEVVALAGINLIAVCAYAIDNRGFVMIITEDNKKTKKLLEDNHFDTREEEVVLVSLNNKPGALQAICDSIANAGIDLTMIYGSVTKGEKSSRIVLVSEDNEAVMTVLRMLK